VTTTQDLTLREAQLIEAARELLQLSKTLHQDQTEDGHYGPAPGCQRLYAASALQVLVTGCLDEGSFEWANFSALIGTVAAEERNALGNGDPAEHFNSPDALIEAINEERAEQAASEGHLAALLATSPKVEAALLSIWEALPEAVDWSCNTTDEEIAAAVLAEFGKEYAPPVNDLVKASRDMDRAMTVLNRREPTTHV
jgi:hypothetical protein